MSATDDTSPWTACALPPAASISLTVAFGGLLVLVVVDRDRGSLPAQLEADRVADPAVTAGDDGGLVLQRHPVPSS